MASKDRNSIKSVAADRAAVAQDVRGMWRNLFWLSDEHEPKSTLVSGAHARR
jgi:hypothetical protein